MSVRGEKDSGIMSQIQEMGGGMIEKVGDWVDQSKTRRALFFGVAIPVICALGLALVTPNFGFFHHGFAALKNPSWMTVSGAVGIGAVAALSIHELFATFVRDLSDKNKRRIAKIQTIALPVLYAFALFITPAVVLRTGGPVGGFATTTYGLLYGTAIGGFFYLLAHTAKEIERWPSENREVILTYAESRRQRFAQRESNAHQS